MARGHRHVATSIHPLKRTHLLGIAGAGMRALADVLCQLGWQVSGSDQRQEEGPTYRITPDDSLAAIDRSLDLVVYSPAIPPEHPQLVRARQLAIPTVSYPQMVGQLMGAPPAWPWRARTANRQRPPCWATFWQRPVWTPR